MVEDVRLLKFKYCIPNVQITSYPAIPTPLSWNIFIKALTQNFKWTNYVVTLKQLILSEKWVLSDRFARFILYASP